MSLSPVRLLLRTLREQPRRSSVLDIGQRSKEALVEACLIAELIEQIEATNGDRLPPRDTKLDYRPIDVYETLDRAYWNLILNIEEIPDEGIPRWTRNGCCHGLVGFQGSINFERLLKDDDKGCLWAVELGEEFDVRIRP